jgi:hypothetical protein
MFGASLSRLSALVAITVAVLACNNAESNEMASTTDTADAMGGDAMGGDAMAATDAMGASGATGTVEYTVVVKSRWTRGNHPFEYPSAGALTGPHFSGVIGVAHDSSYAIFREGTPPTPGLENLSETGRHAPLDAEIRAATQRGAAATLFETGPLRDFGDSLVTTVRVDERHPLVSLVAMVAPSPDWFTGASSVNLVENGQWVTSRTLELNAYDSGGDEGTTYKAPDRDTNPKKPTSVADTRHFRVNGALVPVATAEFVRNR